MSGLLVHRHPASFLEVGLSLQLSLVGEESGAQYGSTVLGWKQRSWIICEWPFHFGQPIACVAGATCLLRYIHHGTIIGYRADVLEARLEPFPFLLLTFPSQVEAVPLRKHGRVLAREPVVVIQVVDGSTGGPSAQQPRIGGLLTDLSQSGCAVRLRRPIQEFFPGMLLRLEFEIVGTGHVNNLTAIVRNVSLQADGTHLGLEFRFDGKETIEYRGWGGSVRKALESFVLQKHSLESA
ncbi:MAG: flagellar brake protein [Nitrospira sp.]|nr:flagellar brake protein [Nitrospira sp.]